MNKLGLYTNRTKLDFVKAISLNLGSFNIEYSNSKIP